MKKLRSAIILFLVACSLHAQQATGLTVNTASGIVHGKGVPKWPVYSPKKNEILDIQSDGKPVGKPDPVKARLDVIEKAVNMGINYNQMAFNRHGETMKQTKNPDKII